LKWGNYEPKTQFYGIELDEFNDFDRLWLARDYEQLLNQAMQDFKKEDLIKTALVFGEINITTYGGCLKGVVYNEQLGFIRK
jgi:hypothetical protein